MDILLLVSRLLLATVFLVAGLAKFADLPGSRKALTDFGVPSLLVAPLGVGLPLAELVVAITLLPASTAWWSSIGALSLLLLFIAGISYNLAHGRTPDCHCFGKIHSEPVGWSTLVRNSLLAFIAGFIIWRGQGGNVGPSALAWLAHMTFVEMIILSSIVVTFVLLAIGGWLVFHLLQQNGRLLARIEALETRLNADSVIPTSQPNATMLGLPVGSTAPAFKLAGLHGETLTLDALRASGKPTLLIFSDPGCGPCTSLLPDIYRWQRDHAAKLTIALISRGTVEANRTKSTEHGLSHVLLQNDREVAELYKSNGTPAALIVRPDGTIGSPLAMGAEAITQLVARSVGIPASAPVPTPNGNGNNGHAVPSAPMTLKVGDPTPALKLPDLTGKTVELSSFRGRSTLVLFWNPGCGFCERMLDDLKSWEKQLPKNAPQLVFISTGTSEANQAMGLRSPILLDEGFSAGRAFGASGTPSAVLVDAKGRIASELGVGAPAVLTLAGVSNSA